MSKTLNSGEEDETKLRALIAFNQEAVSKLEAEIERLRNLLEFQSIKKGPQDFKTPESIKPQIQDPEPPPASSP